MFVGGDLWPPGGAAGVEDEERILRVAPLRLALLRGIGHQGVPAQVHLGVPWHLNGERDRERKKGRKRGVVEEGQRESHYDDNPVGTSEGGTETKT